MAHAIGRQGEMMFDVGLPRMGFLPKGRNVRANGGREWTETRHDLDRIFVRDGIEYGVEIKNTLGYIDRDELKIKLQMCRLLELQPLFIMRMAPKSYINDVRLAGGFSLIFEKQLYPYGHEALARQVRDELGLRVECVRDVQEGHLLRFGGWHDALVERLKRRQQT